MQTVKFLVLTAIAAAAAHADFSYITVTKSPAGETTSKHYIKGQKIITDSGDRVTIMDLDAQTMTTVNKTQKTYTVQSFSEMFGKSSPAAAAAADVNADIKKTGQHQNINGFDAEEMIMTMAMDASQASGRGAKGPPMQMQMEMHMWFASDVPGADELHAFYVKNADRMPWGAMSQGNASMAEFQRKMATMHGIPVRTVMKMGSADPQMQAKMDQARAQMEAMAKQGGPQAAAMQQAMARMGGGGSSGVTSDSSGFSGASVSDSVFAIPPDYKKVDK
jgi:hypothetical protein